MWIYKITNKINGKAYIGQSCNPKRRWNAHKTEKNPEHMYAIHHAIQKYGKENFKFEIIEETTEEEVDALEEKLIAEHRTFEREYGYNQRPGGKNNGLTAEARKRLSENHKAKYASGEYKPYVWTDEDRKKVSERMKGNTWNKGRKASEETKAKMRKAAAGKKLTEEHKAKIAKAHLGKKRQYVQHRQHRKKTCPHCERSGGGNFSGYHFDNCKLKPQVIH